MDVVWGYCGILSLGHFAFFGLGGYMIDMWLMYARTKDIVLTSIANNALPATTQELHDAIGTQIFGVVGGARIPSVWYFADSFTAQLVLVVLVPALPAAVFGWLAIRSRVTGTNGVGKTSLLKTIAGVHPRSGGTITFDGREIGKPRSDELAKAGLAYVPQGQEIFPLLTVRENLETGFACLPRNDHLVSDHET